ncbi:MAG TPA: winged helix-turn-helix domain-containing protein [Mycobacteriales bacterium]|nr:winged helix-turn-helix domain-containing protein [Mycobacteriales bacterium]
MSADRSSRHSEKPSPRLGRTQASERRAGAAQDTLYLQDSRDIRALAHPARLAIIDALGSGDELTATECAELTGLSPSATAYHLKMLQRYDFAERAPARTDGRERPWRATGRQRSVDLEPTTPAGVAAAATVALTFFDRSRAVAAEFIATEHEEPPEWQDAASLASADVWLTPEETRAVVAALAAVVEPYRDRAAPDRPEGSRRVRTMSVVFPHRRT